ncbi:MAG: hypothetical protein K2O67_04780, partial [Clostridia bacterium]|nr:hypothetical protein [Clostridia bacterium]
NIDMQSAVFLAENVTFLGNDGNSKTMPFYGCSISGNEEKTALKVYYKNITANGGNWKHFRYVSKVFSFNFYIGDNGGAAYSAGQWQYVESNVNVDLNGVSGSTLSEEAVTDILAPYFPYACAGSYEGSEYAANVDKVAEKAFTQFDILRNGILYKCVFTTEITQDGGVTTVTYNVSYTAAATVKVRSDIEFVYYGVTVKANTLTEITVPVEGESLNLLTPASNTHNFVDWNITEENGETVYNAVWSAKEFNLKLRLTRGGTDTNIVYIDSVSTLVKGSGLKGTADVTDIKIYGGDATFTVSGKVLTITTNGVTYTVYVNEASAFGKDKNTKRNIKSDINGTVTVTDDMTLTLSY